jgi:predicted RNA methylase
VGLALLRSEERGALVGYPDSDMVVHRQSVLRADVMLLSLPGAVPFLRDDVAALPSVSTVSSGEDYLIARVDGPLDGLLDLQTYASLGLLLATNTAVVPERLRDLADQLTALLADPGPLRFRIGATVPDRFALVDAITRELGWENSASRWHLNLELHDGKIVAQIGPLFLTERMGAMQRLPASTTPVIAAVMVRLAKIRPGNAVLDCFCGAGTILVTAARQTSGLRLIGLDRDRDALRAARENLRRCGALVGQADAQSLPIGDLKVDRVVANLPFGKRVGSHRGNVALYPAFLREAERVLVERGRIVVLTEDKALLRETVQRTRRLKIIREVLLRSGGGTPTAYVIERSRRPPRDTRARARDH